PRACSPSTVCAVCAPSSNVHNTLASLFQSFKFDRDDRLFAISRIDIWRGVDSQLLTNKFEVPNLVRASPGFVPRCHDPMDDFAAVNSVSPSVSTKNSVVERSTFRICYHWTSGRLALAPD